MFPPIFWPVRLSPSSRLRTFGLNLESCNRDLRRLARNLGLYTQPRESPSYYSAREVQKLRSHIVRSHPALTHPSSRGRLTNCARFNASSPALCPARLSTLILLKAWNRLSVKTKMPRWFVLRLSMGLRKTRGQRSLQRNLMASRGVCGLGLLAENLRTNTIRISASAGGRYRGGEGGLIPTARPALARLYNPARRGARTCLRALRRRRRGIRDLLYPHLHFLSLSLELSHPLP